MYISNHGNKKFKIKSKGLVDTTKCGICGGTEFSKLIKYSSDPEIYFIKCNRCKAVTYNKIPNEEEVNKFYDNDKIEYYDDGNIKKFFVDDDTGKQSNITFSGQFRFANHILSKFNLKKDKYRILDFGGGDGQLAYAVALELEKKYACEKIEIEVIDLMDLLYESDNEKISMKHLKTIDELELDSHFDIVIASAVLEHIPDLQKIIKCLFNSLNKNGVLYFRTPYAYPLRKSLSKIGIEYDTVYPVHVWDLGEEWYAWLLGYMNTIGENKSKLLSSTPSIVEQSFKSHFFIALFSWMFKVPWFICHEWKYVGGWEAFYTRI